MPFYKLNGSALLARGQQFLGELTGIEWKDSHLVFATIPGAKSSGATVVSVGIKGAIRGKRKTMSDGEVARPDVVVLDDPQTDEVARAPKQIEKLEGIIDRSIEGLVGPAENLAMVMACTGTARSGNDDRPQRREASGRKTRRRQHRGKAGSQGSDGTESQAAGSPDGEGKQS